VEITREERDRATKESRETERTRIREINAQRRMVDEVQLKAYQQWRRSHPSGELTERDVFANQRMPVYKALQYLINVCHQRGLWPSEWVDQVNPSWTSEDMDLLRAFEIQVLNDTSYLQTLDEFKIRHQEEKKRKRGMKRLRPEPTEPETNEQPDADFFDMYVLALSLGELVLK